MTMPRPEHVERHAERLLRAAKAMVAEPENMDVRHDYVRAAFNHDWTAAAIVWLAQRGLKL